MANTWPPTGLTQVPDWTVAPFGCAVEPLAQEVSIPRQSLKIQKLSGHIGLVEYSSFRIPRNGTGVLSGQIPAVTTAEAVPVSANVQVRARFQPGDYRDGIVVASVQSTDEGEWYVDKLPPGIKYDVIGRYEGYKDVVISNLSPHVED